jgi:hypothetical protein
MKRYIPIILALGLAACAGTATVSTGGPAPVSTPAVQSLAQFTIADLMAASADAKAQTPPDITASQCYDFLIAFLPTIQLPGSGQTVGAILVFQKGRDLINGATGINGQLKSLNLACAPLVIDTQTTINKLLLLGGGAVATGGLLP